jgi:hypothetical protein
VDELKKMADAEYEEIKKSNLKKLKLQEKKGNP